MGRNGGVDLTQLQALRDNLRQTDAELEIFINGCAKELAARLLRKVVKRTPTGQYPKSSGKVGGTLRRGWTDDKKVNITEYVQNLAISHVGNTYTIEITNVQDYASYVEYGHRTRGHKNWIKGKFMMTISAKEIERSAPAILERKIKKALEDCFR